MVVDLLAGKQRFATLMDDIQPMIISQFIIWLDEKVAEFKVQGCMNLDMGTEAPRWVKDYSMSVLVSGTSILGQDPATPTHRLSESVNLAPSRTSTARPSRIHVLSPVSDKSKHIDNQNSRHFSQSMPTRQKRLPSVDDDDDDDDDDDLVVVSVKKEKMDSYECNDFTGAVMPYLSSNSPHKQRRLSGSASAVVPSQITSQKQRPFTSIRKSFHPDAQSPRATPAASSSSIDHAWPSAEQSSGDDTSCERSEPQLEMSVVNVKEASDPVQTLDDTSHSQGWSYDEAPDLKPNTGALELYSRMSPLESSAVSASGDDSVIQPLSLSSSLSLPIEPSTSGVGQSDEGSFNFLPKIHARVMDREDAKQTEVIEIYPGTQVFWTVGQREAVLNNNEQPEQILSKALDVFFSRETLKASSAKGKGMYPCLDENIVDACILSDEVLSWIQKDMESGDTESDRTKKATDFGARSFREFLTSKGVSSDFEYFAVNELDKYLAMFYMGARNKNGELYKPASLVALKHSIKRYLIMSGRRPDIVYGRDLRKSQACLNATLAKLKLQGKRVEHMEILTESDLYKMYYEYFNLDDHIRLQQKVFVDLLMAFGVRGEKDLRQWTKNHFAIETDSMSNLRYIGLMSDSGGSASPGGTVITPKRLYEKDNRAVCPVNSYLQYLSKLHPECASLFQRVKPLTSWRADLSAWYEPFTMGFNSLARMMKTISAKAGLSKRYTNHCLVKSARSSATVTD